MGEYIIANINIMEEYTFVDNNFLQVVYHALGTHFPSLIEKELKLLSKYTCDIIDIISIKFNFDRNNKNIYLNRLQQNNNQDIITVSLLMLPFIDDKINRKYIRTFDDIINLKKGYKCDINKCSPKYTFSNYQYDHCDIDNKKEIEYDYKILENNYELLKSTIDTVSNKLYVNWINIRPFSLDDFKDSYLFENTQTYFDKNRIVYWDSYDKTDKKKYVNGRNYDGLFIGDMYDTLTNNMYRDVIPYKWLIFDFEYDNKWYPNILILNKMIGLSDCIKDIKWNNLDNSKRQEYYTNWSNIINNVKNVIDTGTIDMVKYMLIFFATTYKKTHLIENYGNIFSDLMDILSKQREKEDKYGLENETKMMDKISLQIILNILDNLDFSYIYDFLADTLFDFRKGWFGKKLIDDNLNIISFGKYDSEYSKGLKIKMYYNYAKSLCHEEIGDDYVMYSNLWRGLDKNQRNKIVNRLNNFESFFNISGYLRKIESDITNEQILNLIRKDIVTCIFENMIYNGLLSYLSPNKYLTDETLLHPLSQIKNRNAQISKILKKDLLNDKWKNTFSYLTNDKYDNLPERTVKGEKKKKKYLEIFSEKIPRAWALLYAMDWMSQITCYHKYLNSRVLFITGATGVGKTSQLPKLILYSLKMIDKKSKGRVACTVPRRDLAYSTAVGISTTLGVPIDEYVPGRKNNVKSPNYIVQYKHQLGKHYLETNRHLILRLMTDGTLYQEIRNNPLMKRKFKSMSSDGKYELSQKNVYDVIIIDEAHEHNINMDLILTLMKTTLYYNNDIRLIIMSATMDSDEPSYRRFYRPINNNRLYPLNQIIPEYGIDRNTIDKRVHLSPPGKTTRYEVTDIYVPELSDIDIVLKILNTTQSGNILLFKLGVPDIRKSIKEINNRTLDNIIALPYHGQMTSKKQEFVRDINKTLSSYIYGKHVIFDTDIDEDNVIKVPKGTYTRCIIVATNIAEASVTFSGLKFVVETGLQKTSIFNYKTKIETLKIIPISEQSRLQRRGRVGRDSDGTVYYNYKKGDKERVLPNYDISVQNIYLHIYDLLIKDTNNPKLLSKWDPHKTEYLDEYFSDFNEILKEQYYYFGSFYSYDLDDKDRYEQLAKVGGYELETIIDKNGSFYIFHPEELNINRNIFGDIIGIKNVSHIEFKIKDGRGIVISDKIKSFFEILGDMMLLIDIPDNKNPDETKYIKTNYGETMLKMHEKIKFEKFSDSISALYSLKLGQLKDLISIFALSESSRYNIDFMRTKDISFLEFKRTYSIDGKGDLHLINNIANQVINFVNLNIVDIDKTTDYSRITYNVEEEMVNEKKKFYANPSKVNDKYIDLFVEMQYFGILENTIDISEKEYEMISRKDSVPTIIKTILKKDYQKFENWCEGRYLNAKTMKRFLYLYIDILSRFGKIFGNIIDDDEINDMGEMGEIGSDTSIKNALSNINIDLKYEQNILIPFLYGYIYNTGKALPGTEFYIPIASPSPENIAEVLKNRYGTKIITSAKLQDYIFYLNYDSREGNVISIIEDVSPQIIQSCMISLLPSKLESIYPLRGNRIEKLLKMFGKTEFNMSLQNGYIESINRIYKDMMINYSGSLLKSLYKNNMESMSDENKKYFGRLLQKKLNIEKKIQTENGKYLSGGANGVNSMNYISRKNKIEENVIFETKFMNYIIKNQK